MCNMERIGLTVSEEMSFENVDGQTTDGRTMAPVVCSFLTHLYFIMNTKKNNYNQIFFHQSNLSYLS